jgi:coenzyme Q-binding protein COQ10
MPRHTEQQLSPYTPKQLFDLVVDIEKYPQFLPWCRAARILERNENEFLGELVISFAHITESYTSRVTLSEPHSIDVVMVKGPFEHLTNHWKFTPTENGTRIDFALDFKFRSRILEKLIGSLFSKATGKMVTAFKKRAQELYGKD